MTAPAPSKNTPAFALQAGLSFGVSLLGLVWAVVFGLGVYLGKGTVS